MVLTKAFGFFKKGKQAPAAAKSADSVLALGLPPLDRTKPVETPKRLPSFRSTAADRSQARRRDLADEVRLRLRSAFTPSQPVVDSRMFAGRLDVLTNLIQAIEDQRLHLVLYGDRGIGKTSLLHMLATAARTARYIVVYISCGSASEFDETFRSAAAEVPLLFHSDFSPTESQTESGSTLADLLPPTPVSPRQFGELCAHITGTRMLIMLDEFDRCESPKFRRDLAELIKTLSDRSSRVQLVIAGVAADLAELVEHIPSIRRNILPYKVPLLSQAEVEELVHNGEQAAGIKFEPRALQLVVKAAFGSPYVASLLCHHAGLAAVENKSTTVKAANVAQALQQSIEELRLRIPKAAHVQLERLSGKADALTTFAMASLAGAGSFTLADLGQFSTGDRTAELKRIAQELADEELVLQVRDDAYGVRYAFLDDALPTYLWFQRAVDGTGEEPEVEKKVRQA